MTGNRYLTALARHIAERPSALFCEQVSAQGKVAISWGELGDGMGRFAQAYRGAGLGEGDQVLIFLRHVPDLYGSFFGAMAAGCTPAFLPCASPRQDIALYWSSHTELLAKIRPAAIVTDRSVLAEMTSAGLPLDGIAVILVEETRPAPLLFADVPESAIGLLQHSSGTTGLKKGVALSYGAIVAQVESYAGSIAISESDVIASWLPLYHDMGLIACMIMPAYLGLTVAHIDPFWWVGRPATLFDALVEHRATYCWLPNFAFEHLASTLRGKAGDYDLAHVRAFISCSEPVKAATFDRFAETFAPSGVRAEQLQCCYAMAETVFAVSQTPLGALPARFRAASGSLDRGMVPRDDPEGRPLLETGTPIPGLHVVTVDEARQPLPAGAIGEIAIRGDFLFSGYNRDPATTADRLSEGTYYSRDLGFVRDGRLYVLGRTDDLIIVNGRNLYAHEIEASLAGIEGLKPGRAVAISVFDERVGSQALVVLAEALAGRTVDDAGIKRAISHRLLSLFEITPRAVELLGEGGLIKTTSGKISRSENLKRYLGRTVGEQGR